MKRVTLLRHGHAAAQAEGGDFFRPLDARGQLEVAAAAAAIGAASGPPDALLVSAALRTRQTAQILIAHFVPAICPVLPAKFERHLYHADWALLQQALRDTAETVRHLLLVGHNPGISDLAARWAQHLPTARGFEGFHTAGWCTADFEISEWSLLGAPRALRFVPAPHG